MVLSMINLFLYGKESQVDRNQTESTSLLNQSKIEQRVNKPGRGQVGAISKAQKIAKMLRSIKYFFLQYSNAEKHSEKKSFRFF